MAVCDKWVALKIVEFLFCVACLVAKRVSSDDEARLALLLQKLSREWSLLNSVTWDSVGGAFADAVYGGYLIITFGLVIARVFQEVPRGRRILEGVYLGFGIVLFLVLGGLELASLDSIPHNLTVNAAVLGTLSLIVAALFLLDLMAPRVYTATNHVQTDAATSPKGEKKVTILTQHNTIEDLPKTTQNGHIVKTDNVTTNKLNGHLAPERPKDLDVEKQTHVLDSDSLFDSPKNGYRKFEDQIETELEKSKFGSLRNGIAGGHYIGGGNYIHLDPLTEPYRVAHYEKELAKFNEKYFRDYLDSSEERLSVKEDYLPEPQTPVFAKVKSGRLNSLFEEVSPTYEKKRQSKSPSRAKTVSSPTLQQLEDYLRGSTRARRGDTPALFPMEPIEERDREGADTEGRASGTPTDPGYVQYTADKWPDKLHKELRTPRHSPT